jgi:hypothetical protein
MRTWKRLIPAVLLVLPFTGSWLRADAETNADAIKQLQKDVKKLQEDVAQLRKDFTDNAAQRNANAEQLRAIRETLDRMARQQDTLRIQPGYDPRSINPAVPPASGTITLQNHYSAPATVRINDRPYRVEPNQTVPVLGVPTGTFQYSVDVDGFGTVEPLRTDNLRPVGYRITIFPRMPY